MCCKFVKLLGSVFIFKFKEKSSELLNSLLSLAIWTQPQELSVFYIHCCCIEYTRHSDWPVFVIHYKNNNTIIDNALQNKSFIFLNITTFNDSPIIRWVFEVVSSFFFWKQLWLIVFFVLKNENHNFLMKINFIHVCIF